MQDVVENRIYFRPSGEFIQQLTRWLRPRDISIPIGDSIIQKVVDGSNNIIFLTGQSTGKKRLRNAIKRALSQADRVAPDYNIGTATMMILHINTSKVHDLAMDELKYLMFVFERIEHSTMQIHWGVSTSDEWMDDRLRVRMVVRDLGRRYKHLK